MEDTQLMCKHSGNCTGENLIGNFPECYDPFVDENGHPCRGYEAV